MLATHSPRVAATLNQIDSVAAALVLPSMFPERNRRSTHVRFQRTVKLFNGRTAILLSSGQEDSVLCVCLKKATSE